jgi:hypothetical protein
MGDPNIINIKVVSMEGNEVHFKMKKKTLLIKLINKYCEMKNINHDNIIFLFDGKRINGNIGN